MTDLQHPQLLYLTNPEHRVIVVNVQVNEALQRFQLTKDQIFNLNSASADMILRNFK